MWSKVPPVATLLKPAIVPRPDLPQVSNNHALVGSGLRADKRILRVRLDDNPRAVHQIGQDSQGSQGVDSRERAQQVSDILEIAVKVEEEIVRRGGQPAFPTGIGVNDVTAHYAPQKDERGRIEESDVVKIDYGVHIDGYVDRHFNHGNREPELLPHARGDARGLSSAAIDAAKRDRRIGEISKAIEDYGSEARDSSRSATSAATPCSSTSSTQGRASRTSTRPNLPMLEEGRRLCHRAVPHSPRRCRIRRRGAAGDHLLPIIRKKTGNRELDELLDRIWNARKTLPFTPRWFDEYYKEGQTDATAQGARGAETRAILPDAGGGLRKAGRAVRAHDGISTMTGTSLS